MGIESRQTQILEIALGQNKKEVISDTAAHTGDFAILQCVTDCVISAITDARVTAGSIAGETLLAGFVYCGEITSITLSSGIMVAYNIS